MKFDAIISPLLKKAHLSPKSIIALRSRSSIVYIKKGSHLLYPKEVCKYLFFVSSGLLRKYSLDFDLESTLDFASDGEFMFAFESFHYQVRSNEGILCEKDAIVLKVRFHDLLALREFSPEFTHLNLLLLQDAYIQLHKDANLFRTANARDKYVHLAKKYPGILNAVSHKHIASYLGITPAAFSNLMKELL